MVSGRTGIDGAILHGFRPSYGQFLHHCNSLIVHLVGIVSGIRAQVNEIFRGHFTG
ncbi:unnamed protein product [Spirodela intermedia]|uniref:Uncharacterized protein n=2 Tax=Spirodela intermedia TaxID=51605 RepID=A0A7I8LER0_SPIIN|nr:unnamed protein product [Spirodela intermedia]CAA6671425.1 unnamed protein product [Spirodela intermedia]CAA7408521.1 unnamed protein product [Spirodela intermedia]